MKRIGPGTLALLVLALLAVGVWIRPVSFREEAPASSETEAGVEKAAPRLSPPCVARVELSDSGEALPGAKLSWAGGETICDASGAAEIPALATETLLTASAPGCIPHTCRRGDAEEMLFALQPSTATVRLSDSLRGELAHPASVLLDGAPVTIENGMGECRALEPSKPHTLSASAPGYKPVEQKVVFAGGAPLWELSLVPYAISGVVLDEEAGEPLPGATLRLLGQSIRSDEEGNYEFYALSGLEAAAAKGAEVELVAEKQGYQTIRIAFVPGEGMKFLDLSLSQSGGKREK